jgi:polyisoprenoid-binding protein YceI
MASAMKILPILLIALSFARPSIGAEVHKLSTGNTTIKFVGSKKDGKHEGTFTKLDGTLVVDKADPSKSSIEVTMDVESLTTDAEKLTAHLKSPDFFDAKRFPQAKFVSKSIKAGEGKDNYTVAGELEMLGKSRPVTFPAKAVTKDGTTTVSAQFEIKRSDWGMKYSLERVNDAVQLSIEVKGPAR